MVVMVEVILLSNGLRQGLSMMFNTDYVQEIEQKQ